MKTMHSMKTRLIMAGCMLLLAGAVQAQNAGVVESRGVTPGQRSASSGDAASGNTDALSLLLEQNQQLRAELQALRAMVEEQGFEVRKLQRDSLNRYTNIDERLTALESAAARAPAGGTPASGNTSASGAGSTARGNTSPGLSGSSRPTATAGTSSNAATASTATASSSSAGNAPATNNRDNSRGTLQPAVLSEQQLYQMAYDSVINSNFERSLAEFDQYLSIYPQGRFVTNAHYWKGQAFLYLERFAEARDSYEIIIDEYPDSAKLPDAMYGLGLAYQGLGNIPRARQLMNEIKRRFPNTGVANLADTRLLTLD